MSFLDGLRKANQNNKDETQEVGIGGFRLFAKTDETTTYSNVVPTVVLEDGTNASDDILNNQIPVTITGVVGDVFVENVNYSEIVPVDFSDVGRVTEMLPAKSQQQVQRVNQINDTLRDATLISDEINKIGGDVYNFVSGNNTQGKSNQGKFIEYMESIYFSGTPINVSTRYRDYSNMALEDLTISSNSDGDVKFSAKFLQVNFTNLVYVPIKEKYSSPSNALSGSTSDPVNNGGQKVESNKERSLLGALVG